jgi:hypothetical protein
MINSRQYMTHDRLYLFKRKERTKRANKFSLTPNCSSSGIIMNGGYTNNNNALNEARYIISQKNYDDLTKLMNNDDEIIKLIGNLSEV